MTQGELEKLGIPPSIPFSDLEMRIMEDIVRRIKINGFSTASSDWQITRLQQLGESEENIKKWVQETLSASDAEIEHIFSDEVYEQYMGHRRAYTINGMVQIPFEENVELQSLIEAVKRQTTGTFRDITGSLGFVKQSPTGHMTAVELSQFYRNTLDAAIYDIQSGTFDYNKVLTRTINDMTKSGLRWIDYESGFHNRVDVAARRAVMTGFRQVQGKINEQVASQLGTDTYEVTYHVGARPTHQLWQGRVWTMRQLRDICGLGSVTGLNGANCYHDYLPFILGVSVRTYTDEQLEQMMQEENTPKVYNGKEYTTYEALQQQRKMETAMKKTRQDISLMENGDADQQSIIIKKARYQGQMQTYKDFSDKMNLPEQMSRVYQDGLGRVTSGKLPEISSSRVTRIKKETAGNIFNIEVVEKGDTVSAANVYKGLNKSDVGREALNYIKEHETSVDIYYNLGCIHDMGMTNMYGMTIGNHIYINGVNTQSVSQITKTIIHEEKHIELNISGDQHAEAVCDYYAALHEKGRLTGEDIKAIIKSVKERYPEYTWRRRG